METSLSEINFLDDSMTLPWISVFLSMAIPDASVRYEYVDGVDRFIILRRGITHHVDFEHDLLSQMHADEILAALDGIANRLVGAAASSAITTYVDARVHLQAA